MPTSSIPFYVHDSSWKSLNLASKSQTPIPHCLPDISLWMCQRLLKLGLLKFELNISPQKLVFF